jgi:hypothetical protein
MSAIKLSPAALLLSLKSVLMNDMEEDEATEASKDLAQDYAKGFLKHHGRIPDDQTTLQEWLDSVKGGFFEKIDIACYAGPLGIKLAQEVTFRAARRVLPLTGYPEFAHVVEVAASVLKQKATHRALLEAMSRYAGHMSATNVLLFQKAPGASKQYSAQWGVHFLIQSISGTGLNRYSSACHSAWSAAVDPTAELALQEQDFKEIMAALEASQ